MAGWPWRRGGGGGVEEGQCPCVATGDRSCLTHLEGQVLALSVPDPLTDPFTCPHHILESLSDLTVLQGRAR